MDDWIVANQGDMHKTLNENNPKCPFQDVSLTSAFFNSFLTQTQ